MHILNPKSKIPNPKLAGFTLIELLVVIAIIAVLVAMLLPALSQARTRAKGVDCMSHLSQASLAFMMYSQDYGGKIFLFACNPPGGSLPEIGWPELLSEKNYLQNLDVATCPSQAPFKYNSDRRFRIYGADLETPGGWQGGWLQPYKSRYYYRNLERVDAPDLQVIVADSVVPMHISEAWVEYWVISHYAAQNSWGVHLRHSDKASVLFTDGHVGACGIREMRNASYLSGYMGNGDWLYF